MKPNTIFFCCLIAFAVLLGFDAILRQCHCDTITPQEHVETTIQTDTIRTMHSAPVPKDSVIVRYVEIQVPVDGVSKFENDTVFPVDSITVTLPITQKLYQDTTYKAWVSGYQPSLDSIEVYRPRTVVTKTITRTETKYKTKRWGIGVQAGFGVTPSKFEPYIGIGVTYNIFSW